MPAAAEVLCVLCALCGEAFLPSDSKTKLRIADWTAVLIEK
jgi:hypothetical protein